MARHNHKEIVGMDLVVDSPGPWAHRTDFEEEGCLDSDLRVQSRSSGT